MFSRSLLPSYALEAARRTTPIQEDDNLIQLESQATGFATVQTTFAVGETKTINLMDQTMEMAALDDVDDASAVQATPVISPVMATIPLAAEIRQETEVVVKPVLASRLPIPRPAANRSLRYSLPVELSNHDPAQRFPPPQRASPSRVRKSLSPRHAAGRHSLGSSVPPSNVGTLLALPLTSQFAALKTRNGQLTAQALAHQGDLTRAMGRIAALEKASNKEIEELKMERDGWQSEATRMTIELAALPEPTAMLVEVAVENHSERVVELELNVASLQTAFEKESAKKQRYKDMNEKLRCELENRRLKEKWDLAIMDVEDRKEAARTVGLEFDLAMAKLKSVLELVERQELEEQAEIQESRLANLTAARTVLLTSYKTSQTNLSSTRSELSAAAKEFTKERDAASTIKRDLIRIKAASKQSEAEAKAKFEELEAQVEILSNSVAAGEISENKKERGAEKELVELKKILEKEKTKREKMEADARELKSSLKLTQTELSHAKSSVNAATKAAEVATRAAEIAQATMATAGSFVASTSKAVKPAKAQVTASESKPKKSKPSPVVEEEEADEGTEEEAEVVAKDDARAKKKLKAAVVETAPSPSMPSDSDGELSDSYRPATTKSNRGVTAPVPAVAAVVPKKVKTAKDVAKVLGEKSVNAKSSTVTVKEAIKEKGGKKRELVVVVAEEEDDEENNEPAKKKKKVLSTKPKKFDWGALAETADINGLGLPSILSPIKPKAPNRPSIF